MSPHNGYYEDIEPYKIFLFIKPYIDDKKIAKVYGTCVVNNSSTIKPYKKVAYINEKFI